MLVIVEGITECAEADGVSADSIHADIEAMLADAGIPVLTEPQWQDVIGPDPKQCAWRRVAMCRADGQLRRARAPWIDRALGKESGSRR